MRQLVSSDEATEADEQPTSPCSDCPFARVSLCGWLGGSTVEEWVAAVHSEAELECHTLLDHNDTLYQCAGAAIFRANLCKVPRDPKAFRLEHNHTRVFSTSAQFREHHGRGQ